MRYADSHCTYTEEFEGGKHVYVYTGKCVFTGKQVTVRIPADELFAYRQGSKTIQRAMPSLSDDDREFLISGVCTEAFDEAFSDEEDEVRPQDRFIDPLDDDRDPENPSEYSESYDWSKHDFDNDPDWR